jgi:hypothetical protein
MHALVCEIQNKRCCRRLCSLVCDVMDLRLRIEGADDIEVGRLAPIFKSSVAKVDDEMARPERLESDRSRLPERWTNVLFGHQRKHLLCLFQGLSLIWVAE